MDNPKFFTDDVKVAVITFILERTSFLENTIDEDAPEGVGIQKLLNDKVFRDAYPLHDVRLLKHSKEYDPSLE